MENGTIRRCFRFPETNSKKPSFNAGREFIPEGGDPDSDNDFEEVVHQNPLRDFVCSGRGEPEGFEPLWFVKLVSSSLKDPES